MVSLWTDEGWTISASEKEVPIGGEARNNVSLLLNKTTE